MAQQDTTEMLKEFLRQVIKYRFWISVSMAALFAMIAYVVGSRPIQAEAAAETAKIVAAKKDVEQYTSPTIPTADYKPIVEEKTQIVTKDVNVAWKALYERQAPLLTWPETVQERFRKWGRKWPEGEDPGKVELAKVDYMMAYPDYVTMVYKTFKPFDFETGEGIVAAAPKEALLQPVTFKENQLPGLSVIWAAQERLWIQRTLLEVIAQVNRNAKDWDGAIVKQIADMVVGDPLAQDQRSLARGDKLKEPEKIKAPNEPAEEESADAGGAGGAGGVASSMMSMMGGGRKGGMMGGGGGMMGGASNKNAETIFYVDSEAGKDQYKIMPLMMTVLIDQDHIQDFLIELENSPMWIQVMDFEMNRPSARVVKPEKGSTQFAGAGGMGMMGGMTGGMSSMMSSMMSRGGKGGGMTGFGGMMGSMQNQMASQMSMMMRGGMGRGGMGGLDTTESRKGTDNRTKDRAKERSEAEKAATKPHGPTLFDPHFDIVEVKIYGQARFFNQPPTPEATEPSMGATPDASATPAATGATPAAKDATTTPAPAAAPAAKDATPAGAAPATKDTKTPAPTAKDAAPAASAAPATKDATTPAPATKDATTPAPVTKAAAPATPKS